MKTKYLNWIAGGTLLLSVGLMGSSVYRYFQVYRALDELNSSLENLVKLSEEAKSAAYGLNSSLEGLGSEMQGNFKVLDQMNSSLSNDFKRLEKLKSDLDSIDRLLDEKEREISERKIRHLPKAL